MMKKVFCFCFVLSISLISCTNADSFDQEIEEEGIDENLSALEFNNRLMMSQSMIHTKIVDLWDAENDSIRRSNMGDLSFELRLHLEKIKKLKCSRTYASEFKTAVVDYFHFVDSNQTHLKEFVRLSNSTENDINTDNLNTIADQFSLGYNVVMDTISAKQEKFASLNKVNLK
jgi:hypothetical protein